MLKYERKFMDWLVRHRDILFFGLVTVLALLARRRGLDFASGDYSDIYLGGITFNDCELISIAFNEVLDREDYIPDQYIFEVSSPGLLRPLKKERDYEKSIGRLIDIKLYKPVDKCKEFTGVLKAYDKDTITLTMDNDEDMTFDRPNLAMIRWAFVD